MDSEDYRYMYRELDARKIPTAIYRKIREGDELTPDEEHTIEGIISLDKAAGTPFIRPLCRVSVKNITSDVVRKMTETVSVHEIVCDHITELSGETCLQKTMVCSDAEYESIRKNGFYEADMEDSDMDWTKGQ